MPREEVYTGHALVGEDLEERDVQIHVEEGRIVCIEEIHRVPDTWICPAFFNAHTHIGDTVAMDTSAQGSLADLVTPPHGLKHRILSATPRTDLISAMRASMRVMVDSGTHAFADFREGGEEGANALREALENAPIESLIFGRDGGERVSDGIGIPGTRDISGVETIVSSARREGKLVAIHAGERDPGDMEAALALDPDLLIHCTHATEGDLRECADRGIPIALCPRSNWILGVSGSARHPPIRRMQEIGCTLLLGTDNAMFVQPDMLSEMAFTATVYKVSPREVIQTAVLGSKLFLKPFFIQENAPANFFSINPSRSNLTWSANRYSTIVKRVNRCDITKNVINPVRK
ncbi:MAG TPA: amidohydrolase family protein [Methanomicrobiales archaeon]|nr:amidohydrolase family protein [Methanomicrobiales archaeon]